MARENADKTRPRYLLSGASGLVGSAIHGDLEKHASVTRLVRREPVGREELRWDPAAVQPVPDAAALEGIHAAIHLSGANLAAHRWTDAYRREIISSRVDSTRALAVTLAGLRQPPKTLMVASAVGIYGNRKDEELAEDSVPGSGFLAELCQAWEAAAAPALAAGIRVVHLRFGVVLAPRGGALARMLPVFLMGLGGPLGSGRQWMSWISLADLVAAVRFILDSPQMKGALNLTSPQPVTNTEFTRTLARALHRPAVLPAPAFALRLALGAMADEALLASTRAIPRKLLDAGFRFRHPALETALQEIWP